MDKAQWRGCLVSSINYTLKTCHLFFFLQFGICIQINNFNMFLQFKYYVEKFNMIVKYKLTNVPKLGP
jgi:hypothetical protein